jgi:hypothetical protein
MATKTAVTQVTLAAGEVNFADDTLSHKLSGTVAHFADKFMPWNATKTHITLQNLQVRRTNSREANAHQRQVFIRPW